MSPGIGVGVGLPFVHLQRRGGFSPASLFSSGEEGAWYDPSDLSTLWQDAAGTTPVTAADQPVGRIDDKSGNGNHATQSTAGSRPLYKTAGGLHWLESDGVDDLLATAFTLEQPFTRVTGGAILNDDDRMYGSYSSTVRGQLYVNVDTRAAIYSGAVLAGVNSALSLDTNYLFTEVHNGASSKVQVNNNTPVTGNAGSDETAGGITLFANKQGGTPTYGECRFYGGVCVVRALTGDEETALRTYLAEKSGVTL